MAATKHGHDHILRDALDVTFTLRIYEDAHLNHAAWRPQHARPT